MENLRPICVLVSALGGQGGGVLADWMVEAAKHAGYPAQATSTPGVAQRTGATTYYFELFPEKHTDEPIFTLFPGTGDLDIVAALEPTEAGRALEKGYITDFTTVITGLERVYSTAEKMAAGDGTINEKPMMESIENASSKLIRLNIEELAGSSASKINAVIFGAIVGSGILPLNMEDAEHAIREKGVAIDANINGFEIGFNAANTGGSPQLEDPDKPFKEPPEHFKKLIHNYPDKLHQVMGHGIAKLVDYQDISYAEKYLDELSSVFELDKGPDYTLTEDIAKRLALWMSFEDVIRVAQLKTRKGRLKRIRHELNVDESTPIKLTDYFKPGREEFIGILPKSLSWLVPKLKILSRGKGLALHIPTGSFLGFGLLKILSSLRFIRKFSKQYAEEHEQIKVWLDAVKEAAGIDHHLACQTAKLSILSRGYGNVRIEGQNALTKLFDNWKSKVDLDPEKVLLEVDKTLVLAHANPDADSTRTKLN